MIKAGVKTAKQHFITLLKRRIGLGMDRGDDLLATWQDKTLIQSRK